MGRGRNNTFAGIAHPRARVVVREAVLADAETLAALKAVVARRAYGKVHAGPQLERWLTQHCTAEHYRYRIGRDAYSVLVATDSVGVIVAVATMRVRGQRADMSGLYVTTPGRGIGTALVRAREELACARGCVRVRASVWRSNEEGKRFVEARGLKRAGGYRETTVGVMVDHYEGDLKRSSLEVSVRSRVKPASALSIA
jgi:GNAT superfamily N-acetyltransferase